MRQQMPATCFATASAGAPNAAAALGWLFVFAEPMLNPVAQEDPIQSSPIRLKKDTTITGP